MQKNQQLFPRKPFLSPANEAGGYMLSAPISSVFGETICPPGATGLWPLHDVEFRPSETCPRNFIIFDQTDNRSQIMLHPATGSRFCYPGSNTWAAPSEYKAVKFADNEHREVTSLKEDSDDINALLSSDDEHEECDDDELSTARANVYCGSNSPDSCSNYDSPPRKTRITSSRKTSGDVSSCTGRKRQRMRKMVKALRGIVPGAHQMDTVAVLDEAVRYLKSLKVEVQKLGVGKLKSYT
ncbi:transcription factor bHLH144 [Coffea eugenioides]|uniref:Transcription factor bHLH144-like n=1 Tax=Coffea arabica TaxID=13443 RepID=A0A6P6UFQ6_COFAR|nr:transcription factor bHLH144-like [Coffea arabica]XP_027089273.1 transcription factor bHLH144-like [Coffea arabica]XP_027089274.1 transcription factor bHLH144-like [Coffea arabica]XP_027089275.1 transcription factor bHLH144-like [Coffea arabica]XP_027184573.1 transcription factor bHLH144 [Coffea eugenioides]XP_027184574.1 transcription factor bHLH144 [Coffea eugenioides]